MQNLQTQLKQIIETLMCTVTKNCVSWIHVRGICGSGLSEIVGSAFALVGSALVGSVLVGSALVGSTLVGSALVASSLVGCALVGSTLVGPELMEIV